MDQKVESKPAKKEESQNYSFQHPNNANENNSKNFTTNCEYENTFFTNNDKNYQNMVEYARDLQPWLYQYRFWNSFSSFSAMMPYYMMQYLPPVSPVAHGSVNQTGTSGQQRGHESRPAPNLRQGEVNQQEQQRVIGTEYVLPSLFRRMAAELIDFIVLFYLKVMLTVMVLRHMGYLRDDNLLEVRLDVIPILDLAEMDVEKVFNVTSEIIALEIINRIMITIFETLCLRKGFGGTIGGATPGKRVLGMKVVSCEQVQETRNGKVLVIPARDPGFISALVRSVIKNFTMAFFFPACLTVFFFQHNRAAYDVLAKTIVVQSDDPRWR